MASLLSSLFGFGGPQPTPEASENPTTDNAATYVGTGDHLRVSGRPGRIAEDEDASGCEKTLEVAHSAAQELAAASSTSLEPLREGEIDALVDRFARSNVGSELKRPGGKFDVDAYLRAQTAHMENTGLKKVVENPESRANVSFTVRPAFDKMRFFVNPTDITSGVSTSATE